MNQTQDPLARLRADAQGGDPTALFQLASALVQQGQVDEAQTLHRRAAEAGHVPAQIEYARMRMYGIAGDADPAEAVRWLQRAEAAHPAAAYLLALIGLGGVALPRDAAINARTAAALNAGFIPALLAAAIHFGRKPDPADQTLALRMLQDATVRGDSTAALLLAERLRHGEGCEPDPASVARIDEGLARAGIAPLPTLHVDPPVEPAAAPRTLALDVLDPPPVRELATHPRVGVIDGLLSADECRLLIARARPLLRHSRTLDPDTGEAVTVPLRTSRDISFDPILEDLALRAVQARIAAAAGCELVEAEQLIVLHYAPGQEYRPHRDYRPPGSLERDRPQAGNRARTICVYLNAVEAGGGTAFPVAGLEVEPKPGRAVVFDNLHADGTPDPDSLHAGLPVESGEKWLATLWIRERRYRDF
ncbi:MAG TPA: 2OG-Fe(II) oxygenase [Lysobacter sp.]|nr:2OG-Fe(II) oxygenase [Lysobacter sp.]